MYITQTERKVKATPRARKIHNLIYFSKSLEAAKEYAERVTDMEFYGEGVVLSVTDINDKLPEVQDGTYVSR